MAINVQNVRTQSRLDVAQEGSFVEPQTGKAPTLERTSSSVLNKLDPATIVTLSDAAKSGENKIKPSRNPKYDIIDNYEIELARDPTAAITKFTSAFIDLDKKHLAYLESDADVINLLTGKPVTPEVRKKLKESTLQAIKENEAVLQEHLYIAAGGNPAGDKAKAAAALDTLKSLQNASTSETSPLSEAKPSAPTKPRAHVTSASNTSTSAALLIDLLTKGNEAYRAAVKRSG